MAEEDSIFIDDNIGGFDDTVGLTEVDPNSQDRDDSANPYISNDMSVILKRPQQLVSQTWSSTQVVGTSVMNFFPFRSLMNVPYNNKIIKQYRFFRASVRVRVVLQSTMMHYGKLMVSWLPVRKTTAPLPDYRALFALDVNTIDAAKPEVLEFTIPFMSPLKWFHPSRAASGDGNALGPQVFINVLAPLGNAQSTTASVPITCFAEFVDPQLAGPITSSDFSSGEFVIYQSSGSSSGAAYRIDSERQSAREAVVSTPQFVGIRHMATVGQSLEEDTTVRLALSSDNTSDVSKKLVQSIVPNEHNLISICKRPVLLDTVQITSVSPVEVASYKVSPTIAFGPDPVLANMQVISRLAKFWHGSMKYIFMFTTSHVSTIRIAAYISYDQQTEALGDKPYAMWDITGSMTKEVEVPYLNQMPYVPVWHGDPTAENVAQWGQPLIRLKIVNALTNGAVSTVTPSCYMNVFAAAGDDFRLFVPQGYMDTDVIKMTPIFTQDNLGLAFAKKFEVLGTSGEQVKIPEYNFGEELIDIMDILHRYTTIGVSSGSGEFKRDVALIPLFRYMYRFRRYGARFKVLDVNSRARGEWKSAATYDSTSPVNFYTHPPWDIVPYTERVPLQVELPYNEAWYYDVISSYVYSTLFIQDPIAAGDKLVYTALSSDSVLSFPQWAVQYDNTG